MSTIKYADTDEIKQLASDIKNLANEYEREIMELFRRFNNVPNVTKEWIGGQSEKFFDIVSFDKEDFDSVGETIKSYADKLVSDSDFIESRVNKVIKEERNDKN